MRRTKEFSARSSRPHERTQELNDKWVTVGVVVGPHGIRGEVKVISQTERPGGLVQVRQVTLALPNRPLQAARIVGHRRYEGKGVELIAFEGITNRSAAEALRGARLMVRKEDSPPLPAGEYYDWQILGLQVETTDGRALGVIEEILRTGANDVYVTSACLVPATAEFIQEIDLEQRRVVVVPVPGLLDS
ncbi:MAG: ribosome maturation factor RimM [Candidatus Zipacnadales bacterium]